jgi:TolB protein
VRSFGRVWLWATVCATAGSCGGPLLAPPAVPPAMSNEIDLFGRLGPSVPVRFVGAAASGLAQHTFGAGGDDCDPDVCRGMLVFSSTRHSAHPNLYLRKAEGGAITQLTDERCSNIQPAFSPDGTRIAFASDRRGNWDIFVLPLEGRELVQVTDGDEHEVHPTWSPDGRFLAYSRLSAKTGRWEVCVAPADSAGSGLGTRLLVGEGLFPVWSRQGRLAFQRAAPGEGWFGIWTVAIDGDRVSRPAEVAAGPDWGAIAPAWSPDGARLVFAAVNRSGLPGPGRSAGGATGSSAPVRYADSLWMCRADGTELIRLTADGELVAGPTWGDDGRVYYVSNRSGGRHVWSVRPNLAPTSDVEVRAARRHDSLAPGSKEPGSGHTVE